MLCESDQAAGLSFDDWFGKLAGLPDHLIYKQRVDEVADREVSQTLTESEAVLTSRLWTRAV
jgi:hypothetical protein